MQNMLVLTRYAQDPGVPEFPISQRHRGSRPEHAQRPSVSLFCLHLPRLFSFRRRPATTLSPHLQISVATPKERKECLLNQPPATASCPLSSTVRGSVVDVKLPPRPTSISKRNSVPKRNSVMFHSSRHATTGNHVPMCTCYHVSR